MRTLKKKRELIKIAKEHRKFDRFIKVKYINGKVKSKCSGGFFGCMMQTEEDVLGKASEEMEIPLWLVHVSEKIFDGLKQEEAVEYPVQLLESIPVKKDLDDVYKKFMYNLLMDKKMGQITLTDLPDNYNKVKQCADLFLMDTITASAAISANRVYGLSSVRWAAMSVGKYWGTGSAVWSAFGKSLCVSWSAAWSARNAALCLSWGADFIANDAAYYFDEDFKRDIRIAARTNYCSWTRDLLIKLLKATQ